MNQSIKFQTKFHIRRGKNGRRQMKSGEAPVVPDDPGRVPRISRLMALAIRFEGLLQDGIMTNQAELARLGHVSRARMTQIMNLLRLAPEIQEELLFLPLVKRGRDPIQERQLRPIAAIPDWRKQRSVWREVVNHNQ